MNKEKYDKIMEQARCFITLSASTKEQIIDILVKKPNLDCRKNEAEEVIEDMFKKRYIGLNSKKQVYIRNHKVNPYQGQEGLFNALPDPFYKTWYFKGSLIALALIIIILVIVLIVVL